MLFTEFTVCAFFSWYWWSKHNLIPWLVRYLNPNQSDKDNLKCQKKGWHAFFIWYLFASCYLVCAPLTRYFPAWYRGSKPGAAAVFTENEKQFCTSSCRLNSRMSQKRLPPVKSCLLYMWGLPCEHLQVRTDLDPTLSATQDSHGNPLVATRHGSNTTGVSP